MKLVKFMTGDDGFGDLPDNSTIEVWLLAKNKDENYALLYCPKDKHGCGTFFIGYKVGIYYVNSEQSYINCNSFQDDCLDGTLKNLIALEKRLRAERSAERKNKKKG